jgi:hypothetical protein
MKESSTCLYKWNDFSLVGQVMKFELDNKVKRIIMVHWEAVMMLAVI